MTDDEKRGCPCCDGFGYHEGDSCPPCGGAYDEDDETWECKRCQGNGVVTD